MDEKELAAELQNALDLCGRHLARDVRDTSINHWRHILSGHMKGRQAEASRRLLRDLDSTAIDILQDIIPKIVDTTLHYLLLTLEQETALSLAVETEKLEVPDIADISDGLAGELYTDDGWIARFSQVGEA